MESPGRAPALAGDSNHDGFFDSSDLALALQAGEYEDAIDGNSTFEEGDWNRDGDFTSKDFVFAFIVGNYTRIGTQGAPHIAAALLDSFEVTDKKTRTRKHH